MSSIKQLKKDINNEIGDLIEDIYLWELSNPTADLSKSEKLIDEAILAFDDLIQQINLVKGDDVKAQFKKIQETKAKVIKDLLKKSAKL
ncbi:hypothetical protein N9V60_00365 [Flavobacteriaceae bacterium]|jgi:hypothetical protein|nr:hypothetical protein [Flavobacteriaceae bacterium]MDB2339922.1 hypothetical protein [Flavobacteriaceae bacterium]MDB3997608.1 hypothetical protein [Flavobacteriaceae bacterium]MDC0874171.1 hypothetical protein [Flavobacteriaceae bacterium]